ncbi:hypothetical protein LQZ18_08150 [Lachnospiraceae bacterium ZAX-1]
MYKYKIEKLNFREGDPFSPKTLTLMVDPNNSGKSRVLKDILSLTTSQNPETVILENVDCKLPNSFEEMKKTYAINITRDVNSNYMLKTLSANMTTSKNIGFGNEPQKEIENWLDTKNSSTFASFSEHFGNMLISYLGTEDRLKIIQECPSGNINQEVSNIMQAFYKEGTSSESFLRSIINESFGVESEFKSLIEKAGFVGDEANTLLELRQDIVNFIESIDSKKMLSNLKEKIEELLSDITKGEQNAEDIISQANRKLKKIREENNAWHNYKKNGYLKLDEDKRQLFLKLQEMCCAKGIFIVPVGELESWLINHGVDRLSNKSRWITIALEQIPKLHVDESKDPWKFIIGIHNYLLNFPILNTH